MENRFNKIASSWDAKPERIIMAEKFAAAMLHFVKKKNCATAFEYGCGTGNVSFCLHDCFDKIILADSSIQMIGETQKKINSSHHSHLFPKLLNLETENYNHTFDVIYTLMALHHTKNVHLVIAKFASMLNNGGQLIIGDLDKEDGNFHAFPENQDVHFGFDKSFLQDLFQKNKLKTIKHKIFHKMKREHTGISKTYPLFMMVAKKQ